MDQHMEAGGWKGWLIPVLFIVGIVIILVMTAVAISKDVTNAPLWLQAGGSFLLLFVAILYIDTTQNLLKIYNDQMDLHTRERTNEKLRQEMDLLVAPLFSKLGSESIFVKSAPGYYDDNRPRVREYFQFWDGVKKYKYLGSDSLRSAIDGYLMTLSPSMDAREDENYKSARARLYECTRERYHEIEVALSQE
jgi:hypothetical protein